MAKSRLYTDRMESLLNEADDYRIPKNEGALTDSHFVDEIGPIDMLLDTGATNVVLPRPVAKSLGLKVVGKQSVETAKGRMTVLKTIIPKIQIERTELIAENLEAWLDDSLLLGMNFVSKFGVTFLDHRRRMVISS